MKYLIVTRDWKGRYSAKIPTGYGLFCQENEIETGGDCFAQIYFNGKPKNKLTGQEVYDIHQRLDSEDVDGYCWDKDDERVVIEK